MEKTTEQKALEIANLLEDGKAEDLAVIEVTKLTSCADFFVIATIHSSAHWHGLEKQVKDYARDNDMQIHLTHNKTASGDDWNVIDIGNVLVHLMSKDARNFYELEKLWYAGRFVKGGSGENSK